MAETKEKLFREFPPVSAQTWTDRIISDLKGASFEKKLVWKTGEGIEMNPFYTAEDMEQMATNDSLPGEFPYNRGTKKHNSWLVRQDITVDDCKTANEKAKRLIATGGVTSLGFHLKGDRVSKENIMQLLDGICPEKTELNFKTCNHQTVVLIGLLADYFQSKQVDLSLCRGSVAYDPFKNPLIKGLTQDRDWVDDAVSVVKAGEELPEYRVLAVNACYLNDAGASVTQEAGYALAWGNELIAKLSEAGVPVGKIAKKIKFNFGIASRYFLEIAKFRAVRWLWAEIVKAYYPVCECPEGCCEGDCCNEGFCTCSCRMKAHACTTKWNLTVYDRYVNLLRTQTEVMSAALAGVDSITVLPYDYAFNTPDDFSERMARNQQLLLKEECHFDKTVDPAGGSYYIEVMTQSLADAAWSLFLEVEDRGGFTAVVHKNEVQQAVNEMNKSRKDKMATRRQILLGTNHFPNFLEKIGEMGEKGGKGEKGENKGMGDKGLMLDSSRGASEFEALRLATEKSGKTPKVFMLTIGNLAMRLARAQFSSNFFACAGYEIIDNLGFETIEEGLRTAREKDVDIIVLCSSDDEYATLAPEAYRLIGGKELFVVAGAPACMNDLKAIGIEYFIYLKSNVLETLRMFNERAKGRRSEGVNGRRGEGAKGRRGEGTKG